MGSEMCIRDRAVTASNESDRGLIETILEFGFTVEDDIASGIGGMYGLEVARIQREEDINVSALKLIPTSFIEQNRIIPFDEIEGTLKVAISEPNSLNTVPGVRTITNKKVVPYVITFSDMTAILDRLAGGGELPSSAASAESAPTKLKAVQRKKTG